MTSSRILVGVNDTEGARSALAWAATECQIRGGALLAAHVPIPQPYRWTGWLADAGQRGVDAAGSMLLDELGLMTRLRYPDVPLELLLGHGDPAGTLTDLSLLAELVVLGTTGIGSNLISLIGSVSSQVAGQAHCPVVVVPEYVTTLPGHRTDPTIVVGMAHTAAGSAALHFAFEEALRRRVSVTAVRGWGADAAAESATDRPSRPVAERQLQAELAACRERYPEVPTRALLGRAHSAEAILRAAQDAELVVIGAQQDANPWSSRLAPVPQTVLHHTSCPVVLVGARHQRYSRMPALLHAEA